MKQATRKILTSYSSLASCFLFFSQQKLQAQVIYTDIKDTTLTKDEFSIDLDNDGKADFGISISKLNCGHGYTSRDINIHGESLIRFPRYLPCDLQYSYRPKPLNYGFLIGSHNRIDWSSYWYGFAFAFNICGYPGCNQLWDGKGDRYVGIRIRGKKNNDHDFHYGWIRVNLASDGKSITVKDWAYNATLNAPIKAGQGSSDPLDKKNSIVSPVQFSFGVNSITIHNNDFNTKLDIDLFNALGQPVKHFTVSEVNTNINLNDLSPGLYIARISDGSSFSSQIILVQ